MIGMTTLTAAALTAALTVPAGAAAPDPAFGTAGLVHTDTGLSEQIADAAALPDGSVVVTGSAQPIGAQPGTGTRDLLIAKYRPDGTLDPGFGTAGVVTTDLSGTATDDYGQAVLVQPDGRIVVTGAVRNGWELRMTVTRWLPDGTPDQAFGTGGRTVTPQLAAGLGGGAAAALQDDGSIVVAGVDYESGSNYFGVARYLPDGTLDPAFGTGGTVTTVVGDAPGTHHDLPGAVLLQPDGKILVGGSSGYGYGRNLYSYDFAVVRYTTAGALDPTFGTGGKVVTAVGAGSDSVRDLDLRPDGRILAVGTLSGAYLDADIALAQFTATGGPDPGFGSNGTVLTDLTGDYGGDLAAGAVLQPDGSVLAGGSSTTRAGQTDPGDTRFLLARYDASGTLDPAGTVTPDVDPASAEDRAASIIAAPGGRIVLAGSSVTQATGSDMALAAFAP
ncbi:hypothetical protein [Actinoplanes sp. N902-109]|uniref:hypothetical protein n=1 Tax=Actinoplanes sp. (strain N902-109) TaxID=649831 RepID=UPI0003295984|nr:hypothetical protein [Actinoplanes sp. N902-109]AGL17800.1 hypothetical protein L083_4290 [Actinoplanes sp. N902-109]